MNKVSKILGFATSYVLYFLVIFLMKLKIAIGQKFFLNYAVKLSPITITKQSRWRRKVVADYVCQQLGLVRHYQNSKVRNVVIVSDLIKSGPNYSHDQLIIDFAREIASASDVNRVDIVVTHESSLSKITTYTPNKGPDTELLVKEKIHKCCGDVVGKINLKYCISNGIDDLVDTCSNIISREPHVLLFNSGLDNESRIIRTVFNEIIPVAQIMTQCNLIPDGEVDFLWSSISDKKFYELCSAVNLSSELLMYPNQKLSTLTVDTINEKSYIKGKPIKLMTALTGRRLQKAIWSLGEDKFLRMLSVVQENNDVIWILIGESLKEDLTGFSPVLDKLIAEGKVILKRPTSKLKQHLEESTLYVNIPGVTGGGATCNLARSLGTPVITDSYADAANAQPRGFIVDSTDFDSFIALLIRLIKSPSLRKEYFKKYNELVIESEDSKRVLYSFLLKTQQCFNEKIKKSVI